MFLLKAGLCKKTRTFTVCQLLIVWKISIATSNADAKPQYKQLQQKQKKKTKTI